MDGWFISCYGVDIAVYFTIYDTAHFDARYGVYFGGRIVIFVWCDILCLAAVKVQSCCVASVLYRGVGVFFLCGAVRVNHRLPGIANIIENRRFGGFFFTSQ